MSHSYIIGIGLAVFISMRFVFHFHESFALFGIFLTSIALSYDLIMNEFLPRLFPSSFITITIVDKDVEALR